MYKTVTFNDHILATDAAMDRFGITILRKE